MTEIIGVRFKDVGKIYYFSPAGNKIECGNHVIVETARGVEYGKVVKANTMVEDNEVFQPLKKVIRPATDEDAIQQQEDEKKEKEVILLVKNLKMEQKKWLLI